MHKNIVIYIQHGGQYMSLKEMVVKTLNPLPLGTDPLRALGSNIKEIREKKKLDIPTVARMAQLEDYEIERLEKGEVSSNKMQLIHIMLLAKNLSLKLELKTAGDFQPRSWKITNGIGYMMDQGCRITLTEV